MSDNLFDNMSKVEREAKKPKTLKSFVWIQSADGSMQEVEEKLAKLCPGISREMQSGFGYSRGSPITLPFKVRPSILSLVFHYCRFHDVPGRSYEGCKAFDENFLAVDSITLCELIQVAKYLQVEPLVDCACNALGQDILNTAPGVLHLMMNHGHDFPKANQSSDNSTCNSGNKLQNSLSPKMKKEVEEKRENPEDSRSIDDLVSFINGEDSKEVQSSNKKKKNRKKRQAQNNAPSICASSSNTAAILKEVAEDHVKDPCSAVAKKLGLKSTCSLSSTLINKLKLFDTPDEVSTLDEGFEDNDFDRFVEDFDRKINLSWDDRKWEMYSESERCNEKEKKFWLMFSKALLTLNTYVIFFIHGILKKKKIAANGKVLNVKTKQIIFYRIFILDVFLGVLLTSLDVHLCKYWDLVIINLQNGKLSQPETLQS